MSNGGIKLKVLPKFPSQVIGRTGIEVTLSQGNFEFDLDYADFPVLTSYTPDVNVVALIWNQVTGAFQLVPLTMLGGLSDAPSDGTLYARKGGAWAHPLISDLTDVPWSTWTPTLSWATNGSVPATLNFVQSPRYKLIGKTCFFNILVSMTAVGTGNGGALLFTLPVPEGGAGLFGSGREQAINGHMLSVYLGTSTQGAMMFYDNTSPIAIGANAQFAFGGFYETA